MKNKSINLKLELEYIYLGMDTAVSMGIIVNELVSNSLKHAFPANTKGDIYVRLSKFYEEKEDRICCFEEDDFSKKNSTEKENIINHKINGNSQFLLIIADNGKGIPENFDIRDPDSLGLQLVNLLIEQIDGYIALNRNSGTEFRIIFKNQEK